jgi:hypothetical protein
VSALRPWAGWAMMGPLLGAYVVTMETVPGPMGMPFSQARRHV